MIAIFYCLSMRVIFYCLSMSYFSFVISHPRFYSRCSSPLLPCSHRCSTSSVFSHCFYLSWIFIVQTFLRCFISFISASHCPFRHLTADCWCCSFRFYLSCQFCLFVLPAYHRSVLHCWACLCRIKPWPSSCCWGRSQVRVRRKSHFRPYTPDMKVACLPCVFSTGRHRTYWSLRIILIYWVL